MKVYKFGGASVNSAEAVKNMANIVKKHKGEAMIIVVSAMGKTTNALERVVPGVSEEAERVEVIEKIERYHKEIIQGLISDKRHIVNEKTERLIAALRRQSEQTASHYNYDYDQTVSYGELLSTTIISEYLKQIGIENEWIDVRDYIITDENYREGNVDWIETERRIKEKQDTWNERESIKITQGFIAGTKRGTTTTLGREGSDYTASILSYCLGAEEMTIWKDVPGFLNADPKYFRDTVKIRQLPYNEAIELAYYGASVIHPKTVKPIQNRNIALHIKSFIEPEEEGSVVGPYKKIEPETPLYIVKRRQILISILPRDFSFIAEQNIERIFGVLSEINVKVNLMQNSAISFSICIDDNEILVQELTKRLGETYTIRYNRDLELVTIRYYTQATIDTLSKGRRIYIEQRSRVTAQIVRG